MSLQIHDTLTRRKRTFEPLAPGKVGIYLCGVTVYDLPHVGHATRHEPEADPQPGVQHQNNFVVGNSQKIGEVLRGRARRGQCFRGRQFQPLVWSRRRLRWTLRLS